MDALLSHYSGDVLCLIFPGLIVIGLYGSGFLKCLNTTLKRYGAPSFLLAFCIAISAWFVGNTIDTAMFTVTHPREAFFRYFNNRTREEPQKVNTDSDGAAAYVNKTDFDIYEVQQKDWRGAGVVGFRDMTAIFVFILLFPPKIISGNKLSRWYGFFGVVAFGSCWWLHHMWVYG